MLKFQIKFILFSYEFKINFKSKEIFKNIFNYKFFNENCYK